MNELESSNPEDRPDHPAERWIDVGPAIDVPSGSATEVLIEQTVIAVFHDGDRWHALDGMCAHQGGPIAEGTVADGCVTCPWHGWQYDLASGIQMINGQPLQRVYPVRIRDGRIEVRMVSLTN